MKLRSRPPHAIRVRAALCVLALTGAAPVKADDAAASTIHARYTLRFDGIDVGHLDVTSNTARREYAIVGSGEVSVLFGALKWTGSANVAGTLENAQPLPKTYGFHWQKNKKGGTIALGYTGRAATSVAVDPPSSPAPDTIPVTPEHRTGTLDPLSAVMMLTRADERPPCERRVEVFDGKQRYDIVFTFKRHTRIPPPRSGGSSTIGLVCRAVYVPVAGHRDNASNRASAANRDTEVVLRPVPGTTMIVPYSVTIITSWGTGSMVTDRVDVTPANGPTIALTE